MKRILYILSSDAENLSLILSYQKLIEKGYQVDCYAPRDDMVSLYPFKKNNAYFEYINAISTEILNNYAVVVCGRNCFDIQNSELLISYNGIIIADNTCFYEGHSVFGDIVCTCGEFNYFNIPDYLKKQVHVIGCLKADYSNKDVSTYWNHIDDRFQERILYIESGHFPFGKKGRTILAHEFCRMVKNHPNKYFIVKPRFLENEVRFAKHRNLDHIYKYIMKEFRGVLPDNLCLLDKHEDMNLLINGADICMCTYCSAHIEVVYAKKRFINIYDVPSEEVADFRKNRFQLITDIIDQAGCNLSVYSLSEGLNEAHKAKQEYLNRVNVAHGNAITNFVSIVEDILNLTETYVLSASVIENRVIGYARKKMEYFENRFDDFTLCNEIQGDIIRIANKKNVSLEQKIQLIDEFVEGFVLDYIDKFRDAHVKNKIQKAFCLRYVADKLPEEKASMLGEFFLSNSEKPDASELYFLAKKAICQKEYRVSIDLFIEFLKLVESVPYDKVDVERQDVIFHVNQLLNEVVKLC